MLSVKTPRDLTIAPASVGILEMGEVALVIIRQVTNSFHFMVTKMARNYY